jgi:hypothetical protein
VADARDGRAQPRRVLAGGAAAHMQAA